MQHTLCGFTKFLLLVGFGALTLGWYRDICGSAELQTLDAAHDVSQSLRHLTNAPADPSDGPSIPKGMRLVTLPVHCWSATSGFVRPGDRVDVVSVFRDKATVCVEDVFVSTVHPLGKSSVCPVTLLMTHAQAHTLAEHLTPVWLAFHGDRPAQMGIVSDVHLPPLGAADFRFEGAAHGVVPIDAPSKSEIESD
jgi:hypothetical protein